MRALLDINVLIALLDADHLFHSRAHEWWARSKNQAWASCPITENGVVRIMSNPAYSSKTRFGPFELIERLRQFAENTNHEFWPDSISILDATRFRETQIVSSNSITDIYLLALATSKNGCLVTFDGNIRMATVPLAKAINYVAISARPERKA